VAVAVAVVAGAGAMVEAEVQTDVVKMGVVEEEEMTLPMSLTKFGKHFLLKLKMFSRTNDPLALFKPLCNLTMVKLPCQMLCGNNYLLAPKRPLPITTPVLPHQLNANLMNTTSTPLERQRRLKRPKLPLQLTNRLPHPPLASPFSLK
jgi:hypothetical protein